MKKRIYPLILSLMLVAAMFAGCTTAQPSSDEGTPTQQTQQEGQSQTQTQRDKETVKIATLKGPTGMGMVKLMQDSDDGKTYDNYEFSIVSAPEDMVAKITTGEADIVSVPTNLAATLYNKTEGDVVFATVNTLGVLYILENGDTVADISDLKGKTLYATGKGSTPEFVLNYILSQNGIDPEKDIDIEYVSEHAELAAMMASGEVTLAMLPEPFVTAVTMKNSDIQNKIDLTKEWEKVANGTSLTMSGILVSKEFAQNHKEALDDFLVAYQASTEYINENLDEGAALVEKYGIMAAKEAAKIAIPNCNIVYFDGAKMKTDVAQYLNLIYEAEPKSVGGKLPDDDFYYEK